MANSIRMTDVAPRDGLQNEGTLVPTAEKVRLALAIARSGVQEVEVSSFVSKRWIPQLGDAAEVFAGYAEQRPDEGPVLSALVPNERGAEAALAVNNAARATHGIDRLIGKLSVFTAASETFAKKNTNASIAETLERFKPVITLAHAHGLRVRGYVSCVIECPFEGAIAPAAVARVSHDLIELGCDEIDLGDTIGAATPDTTHALVRAHAAAIGPALVGDPERCTLHLHDTHGRAAACAVEAASLGVRSFDAATGGIGGCPYASTPTARAPGNVDTAVLAAALRHAGFTVDVDTQALAEAAALVQQIVSPESTA